MRILILIQFAFFFLLLSCKSQNIDIHKKWVGYGGALILDLQFNDRLDVSLIDEEHRVLKWKLEEDSLVLIDTLEFKNDTFLVLHHSEDSLVLDMATPRGYVIKTFCQYVFPEEEYSKDEIVSFLSNNRLKIKSTDSSDQIAAFSENGECKIDDQSLKWEIRVFESCVFLIITGNLGHKFFSKVVDFSKGKLMLDVYNSSKDENYSLIVIYGDE
jgi:hypothetical protein